MNADQEVHDRSAKSPETDTWTDSVNQGSARKKRSNRAAGREQWNVGSRRRSGPGDESHYTAKDRVSFGGSSYVTRAVPPQEEVQEDQAFEQWKNGARDYIPKVSPSNCEPSHGVRVPQRGNTSPRDVEIVSVGVESSKREEPSQMTAQVEVLPEVSPQAMGLSSADIPDVNIPRKIKKKSILSVRPQNTNSTNLREHGEGIGKGSSGNGIRTRSRGPVGISNKGEEGEVVEIMEESPPARAEESSLKRDLKKSVKQTGKHVEKMKIDVKAEKSDNFTEPTVPQPMEEPQIEASDVVETSSGDESDGKYVPTISVQYEIEANETRTKKALMECIEMRMGYLSLPHQGLTEEVLVRLVPLMKDDYFTIVNLKNNSLSKLPQPLIDFLSEQEVIQLLLQSNKLREFPRNVFNLQELRMLDLSRNQIIEVPDSLSQLKDLRSLNLSYNAIREIKPDALSGLYKLELLILAHNRLRKLPEGISQLKSIIGVDISHNKMFRWGLPKGAGSNWENLVCLELKGTKVWNRIPGSWQRKSPEGKCKALDGLTPRDIKGLKAALKRKKQEASSLSRRRMSLRPKKRVESQDRSKEKDSPNAHLDAEVREKSTGNSGSGAEKRLTRRVAVEEDDEEQGGAVEVEVK